MKTPRRHHCLEERCRKWTHGVGGQHGTSGRVPWRPSVAPQPEGALAGGQRPAVGMVSGGHLPSLQESSFLNSVGARTG